MNLKVGDVLVFIGNKYLQNKHYDDNIDEVTGYNSECVLFDNHTHGCLINSLKSYFLTVEDYRNQKISKIIE